MSLLPAHSANDCTGRLLFVTDRRVEGRSACSGDFAGTTDNSVTAGTICVYSSAIESRDVAQTVAAGNFVCSDGNHGTVRFTEKQGVAVGIATINAADGRIVTLTYQ